MLELRAGKNRIFIKAVSLMLAQVFLVAGLAYPNDFSCLRSPVMFGGKTDRAIQAEEDFHHSSLNDYFGILVGDTGRSQAEGFVEANPNAWVMFGDMSSIRLMNTVYHPDILDVLIPMSVAVIRDFLREKGYRGLVTRIGLKGDEICLALPQYAPEEADNIRQEAQEKVASSITAKFWACKVKISKDGEPLDLDNGALYGYVSEEAKNILGGDMLSGFYRDEDGVLMIFKDDDVQDLSRSVNMSVSRLNDELKAKGFNVSLDNSISSFGLLSPRVLLGATRFSGNLKEAEHRAEVILNITKQNGMEGGTEGKLGHIDIPKRGEFKTSEGDRTDAINAMMAEEVSGVNIYPGDFEPAYLALRQSHLGIVLEDAMSRMLSEAMVRPTHQPVILGLLDCRYQPYGEAWAFLEGKEDFNTQEKRAKGLRGQTDDLFGEAVAFKYFNDALEGGHNLGNKVLEKEAKAILDVIKELERHNIILFRGPPDNWYFIFLGPSAQDFSENPEHMKEFVDDISDSFDKAFDDEDLKLQVKARLRMNIVASQENMRGPFTIINQVKRIARSRNQSSVETLTTNREAGANQVRLYKTGRREALNVELGTIRAEDRKKAIGFLTEKIMKQIKERADRNALTPNDYATMRVMEQSGWLKGEDLEAYNRLANNQGTVPIEILENGASIYNVLLPNSDRQVEICLDSKTVKLMQELPEGVTLNIFGNQAIQMILGREGVIAEAGSLAEGDLDYSTRNNSGLDYLEMERLIKEHYGKDRELANCVPIGFSKLTTGPFTVSRLVIKLTSFGNGCFTIGFGEYMQERDYDDLIHRNVNVIEKMDAAQYETCDAIQGLIYHHRYGMHLEPEAVKFIKKTLTLDNINKISLKDMPSLRLDKLFKHAKNPGNAVADLCELGVLEGPFVNFVIDVLIETETLHTVLGSKEFLESDVSAKVMEIIRTHRSELLATHKAVNSAL